MAAASVTAEDLIADPENLSIFGIEIEKRLDGEDSETISKTTAVSPTSTVESFEITKVAFMEKLLNNCKLANFFC